MYFEIGKFPLTSQLRVEKERLRWAIGEFECVFE